MRWQVILILIFLMLPTVSALDTTTNSTYINDFLRNSTGNQTVTGNYAPNTEFFIRPPHNETWQIARLIVTIEDAAINRLDSYGAIAGGLTNGIQIILDKNGTESPITDGYPIYNNGDWGRFNYDVEVIDLGAGNDYVFARWTFSKSGEPLTLKGENNDRFLIKVSDDFTGLVDHTFAVQGQRIPEEVDGFNMIAIMLALIASAFLIIWAFKDLREDFFFFKGVGYIAGFWFVVSALNLALAITTVNDLVPAAISNTIQGHYVGFTYFSLGLTMLISAGYIIYFLQKMIKNFKMGGKKR